MENELIYCGACGKAAEGSLFRHLREEHALSPAAYRERCPNAPLFTPAFGKYLRESGAGVVNGEIARSYELFGLKATRPLRPLAGAPEPDGKFRFEPSLSRAVLASLLADDRMLLVGPTGSGKSSLVVQLAARLNWPLRRINLHGEAGVSDLLGQHKARAGEVYFQYGVLPVAMREGWILCLEELDAAAPEMLFVLQGVMEERGELVLADNGGEVIRPHPDFRLVATANTLGLGDETSLYTGTNVLNASHLDRWTTVFTVDYPERAREAEVLRARAPELPEILVDGLVGLAGAVRKAAAEEQLFTVFSTRRLVALAVKITPLGLKPALEATVLNKLPGHERAVVAELAQRHLPGLARAS